MVTVPTFTGETIPEPEVTVANEGVELVHVPPPSEAERVTVVPIHTVDGPEIVGIAFTVTIFVA